MATYVHNLLLPLQHTYGSPDAENLARDILIRVVEIPGVKRASLDLDAGHILVGIDPEYACVQDVIRCVLSEGQRGVASGADVPVKG